MFYSLAEKVGSEAQMVKNYPKKINESVDNLKREKIISPESAKTFGVGKDRTIQVPSMEDVAYDPVLTCILIDRSGSMIECRKAVLESHPFMINALRESSITRHGAHFISQYLFSSEPVLLHGYVPLGKKGQSDKVTLLNDNNYNPEGRTALYQTLFNALQDMLGVVQSARSEGLSPKISISVITDGADTEKIVAPEDICRLIGDLKQSKILKSSVLVGLISKAGLSETEMEEIRKKIGFDKILNCERSSERDIRNIFVMASQSALARIQEKG
jgi:hypothetical protein